MAPRPLGPPVRAPRGPVSPAEEDCDDDDDEHDAYRSHAAELDPIMRRSGTTGHGAGVDGGIAAAVASSGVDLDDDENDHVEESSSPWSLQDRMVQAMASWPKSSLRRVAPIQVATELGISVEDATAELCHLMSVVGNDANGAAFSFEKLSPPQPFDPSKSPIQLSPGHHHQVTMVFAFPAGTERKCAS
jgi:hypothetical protein